ncbi:hypothetical protein GCM10010448_40500 [Streptomyces glomeratus]|uniref:Chitinase n=1 Tax=Streptomyces glomeratus TaxID=284452 RepID=A0ABP6LNK5_9ACTN
MSHLRKSASTFVAAAGAAVLLTATTPANASTEIAATATAVSTTDAAAAGSASNPCKGKHYSKVAYTFWIGPREMPLRCGTKNWGHNHSCTRTLEHQLQEQDR